MQTLDDALFSHLMDPTRASMIRYLLAGGAIIAHNLIYDPSRGFVVTRVRDAEATIVTVPMPVMAVIATSGYCIDPPIHALRRAQAEAAAVQLVRAVVQCALHLRCTEWLSLAQGMADRLTRVVEQASHARIPKGALLHSLSSSSESHDDAARNKSLLVSVAITLSDVLLLHTRVPPPLAYSSLSLPQLDVTRGRRTESKQEPITPKGWANRAMQVIDSLRDQGPSVFSIPLREVKAAEVLSCLYRDAERVVNTQLPEVSAPLPIGELVSTTS